MSLAKIIGLLLLAAGVIVLVIGIYQLVQYNGSFGGKVANRAAGFFGGHAKGIEQPVIMIIAGAVAGVAGFFIYKRS
jgi:hypothetical protein